MAKSVYVCMLCTLFGYLGGVSLFSRRGKEGKRKQMQVPQTAL